MSRETKCQVIWNFKKKSVKHKLVNSLEKTNSYTWKWKRGANMALRFKKGKVLLVTS